MTPAGKLARRRAVASALAVGLPLALSAGISPLTRALPVGLSRVLPVLTVLAMLVGAGAFVYFIFLWRPRCPQCRAARGRFVREEKQEFLACPACAYREATGWTWEG